MKREGRFGAYHEVKISQFIWILEALGCPISHERNYFINTFVTHNKVENIVQFSLWENNYNRLT